MAAAKRLRQELTLPEALLWNKLGGKPMGVKFRKQHPIDDYVVEFFCAAKRIAIEIDGFAHDTGKRPDRDLRRDAKLRNLGVDGVRVPASQVLQNVDEAAESIVRYCLAAPPPSSAVAAATSPRGRGISRSSMA